MFSVHLYACTVQVHQTTADHRETSKPMSQQSSLRTLARQTSQNIFNLKFTQKEKYCV